MKIALDDKHFLNSDRYCYWITCICESENEETKKKKKYERRVSGYLPTFEQAIEHFIDASVNESTATSLRKLKTDIQNLKAEVRGWSNAGK